MGAYARGKNIDRFDIEDAALDELAESIPCSSPYFTQPTQILNRTTQPTQIVDKRTSLRKSSSPVPDTPTSAGVVEVPASSPFQGVPRSAVKSGGRLASLMAPAGTAYRPPIASIPQRTQPAIQRRYFKTPDDDLADDYKREDSSSDESPMRGDIQPSHFAKNSRSPILARRPGINMQAHPDLSLNDISNLRLRYLTKETHKIVVKVKPAVTVTACMRAVQNNGWSTEDAVNFLLDRAKARGTSQPAPRAHEPTVNWKQTTLTGVKDVVVHSSTPPVTSPSPVRRPARRRLVQGRRNRSPSPPLVFSVSSSQTESPATTPSSTAENLPASKMAITELDETVRPRGRLTRGLRKSSPDPLSGQPPDTITILSDSDDESLPDIDALARRKRKRKALEPPAVSAQEVIDLTESDNGDEFARADDSDSGADTQRLQGSRSLDEDEIVVNYLNSCSAEELSRMTGLPVIDTRLIISERPFEDLAAAQNVSRRQKSRGGRKSVKTQIGITVVDKLVTWFRAFNAAAAVIKECERRGSQIQAVMSKWEMDRNGILKESERGTTRLPITQRPALMDSSVQLKPYQMLGLNWLNLLHSHGYSGILADDMGLGKTCQVISFLAHLVHSRPKSSRKHWPNLIVVPPSTLENWINEFEKFAPKLKVFIYSGTSRKETEPEEVQGYHVVLTSYSQIERNWDDVEWLQGLDPYAAIFDEGHKLKNIMTKTYKHVMKIPSEWRLVLSGTPVQNNLKELLSLLQFVEPSLFDRRDFERLQTIFEAKVPNKEVHNFAALARERVSNARSIVAPFILQRRKEDVLDLPKKIDILVMVEKHPIQEKIYDDIRDSFSGGKNKLKNSWMQLRKAAIHHQLFRHHFTDEVVTKMVDTLWKRCSAEELYVQSKEDKHKTMFKEDLLSKSDFELHVLCRDFERYIGRFDLPYRSWEEAPKVQKFLELVRGYIQSGDRCLVFSRFEMVINILRETLHHAGIEYCELTGMSAVSDRFPEIQRFNESNIPVFLLTTGAGGTGLNLTAANKIIIFDQSDNPQDDVQASNRAHRIGQTREVEVVRLITKNSVEELIYDSCVKKLMLAACVDGTVDDEESVEDICRNLMLSKEKEGEIHAKLAESRMHSSQLPN